MHVNSVFSKTTDVLLGTIFYTIFWDGGSISVASLLLVPWTGVSGSLVLVVHCNSSSLQVSGSLRSAATTTASSSVENGPAEMHGV